MIGKVHAIAKGGAGMIHEAGKTIFIPGVIAGETVEYAPLSRRRSVWQGKLLRVIEASPRRVEPPCPHYHECGSCNLQHMSYDEQLRSKSEILLANLKKIAGLVFPGPPDILSSRPWRYRSKSEFQVRDGVGGFFKKESHQVIPIQQCLLVPEAVEAHFLAQRQALSNYANAQLRVISNGRELASRLATPGGSSAWLSRELSVRFEVGAYAYQISPDNFIQANLFQLQPMLDLIEKTLDGMNPDTAADLFCGCGFFTIPLAGRCQSVLAIESDPQNLAALRANLELNRASNVRVVQADVLQADLPPAGLYVVDPPRGGLSTRVIAAMAASGAEAVIYFSCDSATWARDLRLFSAHGFQLQELQLLDNFPQTDHFEIFSILKKK
ncbi:MAG: methyltransferase [Acidobacteria bacterium]|nr:methyltransferase [Acidobacteriota bacterium]MBU4306503.1 methyltransferase [Acidobacteriota bacterium]MBU4405611.1 methyltransferase [Acidobacteriota bacterium]MCG2810647.1 methyltransferase [Candidatus Aminicenantes bacterium]